MQEYTASGSKGVGSSTPTAKSPTPVPESAPQGIRLLKFRALSSKESHNIRTLTPAETIAMRMSLVEALTLFSKNAGPRDQRLVDEIFHRLSIAISQEIEEGASMRNVSKVIMALAFGVVTGEVQCMWEGPIQIGP